MKEYIKPKIIVLVSPSGNEQVLDLCKKGYEGVSSSSSYDACMRNPASDEPSTWCLKNCYSTLGGS